MSFVEKENLYWLRSAAMAAAAAALTWGGAGKSGKPSARLTAPTRCARWDSCWMGDGADRLDTADSLCSMAPPLELVSARVRVGD